MKVARLLPSFSPILLIAVLLLYAADNSEPAVATSTPVNGQTWTGMYINATSYSPGDTIDIHASSDDVETVFRLVRLDEGWTEITRTLPMTVSLQATGVGSFLEYPSVTLSNRSEFTLEGWYYPTQLGGDLSVVAGQIGLAEAAAGIVITTTGQLGAYVSDTPAPDPARLVLAPPPVDFENWLDSWHHLALAYDGIDVNLYIDGVLAATRPQTGLVAQVPIPFRIGARAEAPGDLTGVINGRIDSWTLWPNALSQIEIQARMQLGLTVDDPLPNPGKVDLYLGFEGPFPGIQDSSNNNHAGTVTNFGTPRMAGVNGNGHSMRLHHDQVVDADWPLTAQITIPPGTESGMYAVQALFGPNFLPTQTGGLLTVRAFAVRPDSQAVKPPIAVVLPTNTWLAYTRWPRGYNGYLVGSGIMPRERYPGNGAIPGGDNSAYSGLGDGISLALYHGLPRPSFEMSPIVPGAEIGEYSVRAPNSMYMVQWLDAMGYDYDVYSDDDFGAGLILASDYLVLMPHSHHEYWTGGMLNNLSQFLADGGSVAMPAGNVFTWKAVFDGNGVMEVRKYSRMTLLGVPDLKSGIDGTYLGKLDQSAACNGTGDSHLELGVRIHLVGPCDDRPFCFGQWKAQNTGHWLWEGSGLNDLDLFGIGRPASVITPTFAVGHEADTWIEGMTIPGLASGQNAVILAEGTNFDPLGTGDVSRGNQLLNLPDPNLKPTCQDVHDLIGQPNLPSVLDPISKGGTILYFKHKGGGHVLVIGASATPWALESDTALSGLLQRGLDCFVYGLGCKYDLHLPVVLRN